MTTGAPTVDPAAADAKIFEIERLQQGHTDRAEEARILALLRATAPAELDYIAGRLSLAALLHDLDDRPIGPKNRAALLALLCKERLADLSIATRGALIDALQRGPTVAQDEQAIAAILLGTRGRDLIALKNAIDDGEDYRDLQQLVYHDIDDDLVRQRILDHLRVEANLPDWTELKILSDIDDTFYCNWVDVRYPKKTIYPGVRPLPDGARSSSR